MRQDKCKVIDYLAYKDLFICQVISSLQFIECPTINKVKVGDFVLVAYNQYNTRQKEAQGTIIAIAPAEETEVGFSEDFKARQWSMEDLTTIKQRTGFRWKPEIEEEKEMQNHLVELLLKNFYTIGIRFHGSSKVYTYKVAQDISLEEEDEVIVSTTSGYEIVEVVRVDEGMNIDVTLDIKYKFIVQKLDLTQYNDLCDRDKNVAGVIAQGAAERAKQEIVEAFTGSLDEEQVKLLEDCGVKAIKRL